MDPARTHIRARKTPPAGSYEHDSSSAPIDNGPTSIATKGRVSRVPSATRKSVATEVHEISSQVEDEGECSEAGEGSLSGNDAVYDKISHDQATEDDPAETEDLQEEAEERPYSRTKDRELDPQDDPSIRGPKNMRQNKESEEQPRTREDFRRRRRAPSRTPSFEQLSGDDQTESGSAQDEDEESIYSDDPEDLEVETDAEEQPTDPNVIDEIKKFQATFRGIERRFRLINKIGEGTFSSVYKAEDLLYDKYDNNWDFDEETFRRSNAVRPPKYVAIKKIYVTSSPARIQNELELLHDLTGCKTVSPLITAFRYQDQVVAILPYFQHVDFREYFRKLTINGMILYFKSLFSALSHVHAHDIIHRDIKPTNFLYDSRRGRGVLCDFGLAEREGTESSFCLCQQTPDERKGHRLSSSTMALSQGYPKNDSRPSRRANRAGTRGFRAPEVLFKCTAQTTKIDIWSAGVILLTILSKRFPFFNSSDDVDAIIEIATIFGKAKMRQCAALHGCIFETTIPTVGEKGFTLEKIVLWATNRTAGGSNRDEERPLPDGEALACQFMRRCFELDPTKRISADEALEHPFLQYWEEEGVGKEDGDGDGEEQDEGEGDREEMDEEMEM